jgi:ribosomal protein S18 acetylase RimI-like enzyme
MDLTLRTEYWDDPAAREAFKAFILEIHGLDFTAWESAGFWDDAYTPFSFFDGERVVASVCIYLLDAVVEGEPSRLAQISGVGTSPELRRKGLNRRLTDLGLKWARGKHDGVFLFADPDAIPFYRRCGFRPIEEYVETVAAPAASRRAGATRLDTGRQDDRDRLHAYARRRAPLSNRFSVLNDRLLMFHALYGLKNDAYEVPDLDCVVFYRREGACVRLFDIVGETVPSLNDLYPYLAQDGDEIVEFHFYPDKLEVDPTASRVLPGNNPFIGETFPVEHPVFPYTSRA